MALGSKTKIIDALTTKGTALKADVQVAQTEAADYEALARAAKDRAGLSAKQADAVSQALAILNEAGVTL